MNMVRVNKGAQSKLRLNASALRGAVEGVAFTYHPVARTWLMIVLPLTHRSTLLPLLHASISCVMRSMRSCFLPDFVQFV